MAIPKKVADRLIQILKAMSPIIEQQRSRDVSEADTSTLVKDLLSDLFGYDKYADVTAEYAIRGKYCGRKSRRNYLRATAQESASRVRSHGEDKERV